MPKFQRQGVGTALVKEGRKIARHLGYGYSVVFGDEKYYTRFGYVPTDSFGIIAPFDVPRENFMLYKIIESAANIRGIMKYALEFGIV